MADRVKFIKQWPAAVVCDVAGVVCETSPGIDLSKIGDRITAPIHVARSRWGCLELWQTEVLAAP
jgi:NADPH:quinone reductase-like Zn-dependent oxidoreductase